MLKRLWNRKSAAQVKLNIVNAIELKSEANYILVADTAHFTRPELEGIMKDLRKAGVRNVVSFLLAGSPEEAVQLISKESKHATKKSRH